MNIWMRLGRLLPRNREGRWPLPVQLLVFLLIEVLFVCGLNEITLMVYSVSVGGTAAALTLAAGVVLCLARMALHWAFPFGEGAQLRWTALPWTLGYGVLSALGLLLPPVLAGKLPLPTESLMVYTILHWLLYTALACVFCWQLMCLRTGEKTRAILLTAAEVLLAGLLILCSACSCQVENAMMDEVFMASKYQPAVVTTFGDVTEITGEDLSALLAASGLEGKVTIVSPDAWTEVPADPFAAYEAARQPADRLSDVLMWVMRIPLFLCMKGWLFAQRQKESGAVAEN
ncbi:MAG: hypothetical protein IJ343_03390 [Clostridia bacterium]|nr:hypothetical protein [Clostridia bacterium]